VVLITAFGDRPTHAMASALGAVRTLDKPFRIAELKSTIYLALVSQDRTTRPPRLSSPGG
jgi:DNA-binding NtrC family response regulator